MRKIAGSILVLAATTAFVAYAMGWFNRSLSISDSTEGTSILITSWVLGLFGLAVVAIDLISACKSL